MNIEQQSKVRAALTLRALKKLARERAEFDLNYRGHTRNVSAWLSRATGRHYETLLASHVEAMEKEKKQAEEVRNEIKGQVESLKKLLAELTDQLETSNSSCETTPSESPSGADSNYWNGDLLDFAIESFNFST